MSSRSNEPQTPAGAVRLPSSVTTRDGATFDPREQVWTFRAPGRAVSMNFGLLEGADPRLIDPVKATITWYLANQSPDHSIDMFNRFRHFFRTVAEASGRNVELIDPETVINYLGLLKPSTAWYLSNLAGAIKKWHALGWPGVTVEAVNLLNSLRLKGNMKGEAVLTMDPIHGPLTDIERQALADKLKNAWSTGEISLEDVVLCWLAILIAPRPIQLALLKLCDLVTVTLAEGGVSHILRVPRAKQRGQATRSEFKDRKLIAGVGVLLQRHVAEVQRRVAGKVPDIWMAPMFPERMETGAPLEGFEGHCTATTIGQRLVNLLEGLGARSERTGGHLNMTVTRLRRTLATHAAMEGHGELIIADLLDQSDTQNAGVYTEARPEIVERIDRKLAVRLAPLAQAFAGVLVERKKWRPEGGLLSDPRFHAGQPVGGCGTHGFCGFAAPIACYPCQHFQAWLDGPHAEVLDHLLAERERLMAEGDARIASVNDRTILAVAEVVRLCAERRALPTKPGKGAAHG